MKALLLCLLLACSPAFALTCAGTDDTSAVQTALAANLTQIDAGTCAIASTIVIRNRSAFKVTCNGDSGQTNACIFRWNGPAGGTVFQLDQDRDYTFEGISVLPGTGTIGNAFELTAIAPLVQVSTNGRFVRVHVGTADTAFSLTSAAINNDLNVFDSVVIDGSGTNGYAFSNTQSKSSKIIGGSISGRTYGIYLWAGSFTSYGTNFSWNATDVWLGNPVDVITLISPQSEGAQKFLDDAGPSGNAWSVNVKYGRLAANNIGPDNVYLRYRRRGPLNLEGNDFASGVYLPNFRITVDNDPGAVLNSLGNVWPNAAPFNSPPNRTLLNSIGNTYIDSDHHAYPMANVIH